MLTQDQSQCVGLNLFQKLNFYARNSLIFKIYLISFFLVFYTNSSHPTLSKGDPASERQNKFSGEKLFDYNEILFKPFDKQKSISKLTKFRLFWFFQIVHFRVIGVSISQFLSKLDKNVRNSTRLIPKVLIWSKVRIDFI